MPDFFHIDLGEVIWAIVLAATGGRAIYRLRRPRLKDVTSSRVGRIADRISATVAIIVLGPVMLIDYLVTKKQTTVIKPEGTLRKPSGVVDFAALLLADGGFNDLPLLVGVARGRKTFSDGAMPQKKVAHLCLADDAAAVHEALMIGIAAGYRGGQMVDPAKEVIWARFHLLVDAAKGNEFTAEEQDVFDWLDIKEEEVRQARRFLGAFRSVWDGAWREVHARDAYSAVGRAQSNRDYALRAAPRVKARSRGPQGGDCSRTRGSRRIASRSAGGGDGGEPPGEQPSDLPRHFFAAAIVAGTVLLAGLLLSASVLGAGNDARPSLMSRSIESALPHGPHFSDSPQFQNLAVVDPAAAQETRESLIAQGFDARVVDMGGSVPGGSRFELLWTYISEHWVDLPKDGCLSDYGEALAVALGVHYGDDGLALLVDLLRARDFTGAANLMEGLSRRVLREGRRKGWGFVPQFHARLMTRSATYDPGTILIAGGERQTLAPRATSSRSTRELVLAARRTCARTRASRGSSSRSRGSRRVTPSAGGGSSGSDEPPGEPEPARRRGLLGELSIIPVIHRDMDLVPA